jgi:hypothetical protein
VKVPPINPSMEACRICFGPASARGRTAVDLEAPAMASAAVEPVTSPRLERSANAWRDRG